MTIPTEIVFNGMGRSEFIEESVRKHIMQVERRHGDITRWHVAVSAPHKSHRHGNLYEIHICAHVPGSEIVVSHNPGNNDTHDDMRPLIRDAFLAFESQLEKRKGKKHHSHRTALDVDNTDQDETDFVER